jgi:hypothetical protein
MSLVIHQYQGNIKNVLIWHCVFFTVAAECLQGMVGPSFIFNSLKGKIPVHKNGLNYKVQAEKYVTVWFYI